MPWWLSENVDTCNMYIRIDRNVHMSRNNQASFAFYFARCNMREANRGAAPRRIKIILY